MCSTNRKPSARPRQQGYVALALVIVVMVIVSATIAQLAADDAYVGMARTQRRQQTFVTRAAERVGQFYKAHAAAMDANAAAPWTGPQILALSHVPPRWGVQLTVGVREAETVDDGLASLDYRDLWASLPGSTNGGTATPASYNGGANTFTPGTTPAWTEVSGQKVETALYTSAQEQLNRWDTRLTAMYAADIADSTTHDIGVDYWQPPGCGPNGGGEITCTNNAIVPVSTLSLATALGARALDTENPWGEPLTGSNTVDTNTTAPPYTFLLESPLPWGGALAQVIIEPLT